MSDSQAPGAPSLARVARLWWPLAASWLLMSVELPLLTAVVARMPDAKVNLAAYGSVVFPLSLLIEAPIIMLLAASTALSQDWASYCKVRRFMMWSGGVLTVVHSLVAFTPLFHVVVGTVMGVPERVLEPARLGLQIMTPWTWSIAYRRFQQGALIRYEQSNAVGIGTLVRLCANASVLFTGYSLGGLPGVAVGASATASGVVAEACYCGWRVRPIHALLKLEPPVDPPLTRRSFASFYLPLALTPLLTLLNQPIGAAAMSRMPMAIDSLAAWPAVHGLVFLPRSVGMAYNEVVVALVGRPGYEPVMRRFAAILGFTTVLLVLIVAATPLADLWFRGVQGLPPSVAVLAGGALVLAAIMPGYQALQSHLQGILVMARRTRAITESVALYLVVAATLMVAGALLRPLPGLHYAICALVVGGISQTLWLRWRARDLLIQLRDCGNFSA